MKKSLSILILALSVSCMAQKQTTGVNQIVTKQTIGLSNVDNTSDLSKPVSSIQKAYIDSKIGLNGSQGIAGNKGDKGDKGDVGESGGNYDVNKFVVSSTLDRVGVGIANPSEKFHVRWGHIMLEGDGVSYKAKNAIGNTYALATLGNNNVFTVANNLLKLDPQWGSTALSINGGLVASNVPIYINNPSNNFIVKTQNGLCRKLVIADDGTITTPLVTCP